MRYLPRIKRAQRPPEVGIPGNGHEVKGPDFDFVMLEPSWPTTLRITDRGEHGFTIDLGGRPKKSIVVRWESPP